jgi:hypothetical protein
MTKKFLLVPLIFLSLLVVSCIEEKFEINTKIHPKILGSSFGSVAIEYNLGKLLILDELKDLNMAQTLFIEKNKNDLILGLKISACNGI